MGRNNSLLPGKNCPFYDRRADNSFNNKFRDQCLEKIKKTTSDALAIAKQIYDQGDNEVSKAQAAKEVRELFEESGIKDVDNFEFGTGRRANEIKEILSHYDPKLIELAEDLEKAESDPITNEGTYSPLSGYMGRRGTYSERSIAKRRKALNDYLKNKGK